MIFNNAKSKLEMDKAEEDLEAALEMDKAEEELKESFDLYDQDKDGYISADELRSTLLMCGVERSLTECREMIKSLFGSTRVSFEQFKNNVTKGYEFDWIIQRYKWRNLT